MAMDVLEMWRLIYQEELPTDIGPVRQLLERYSKIASSDVDSHLYAIVSATLGIIFSAGSWVRRADWILLRRQPFGLSSPEANGGYPKSGKRPGQ
jgi:hypothetical protein